jgi:LysM repeat protein
MSFILISCSSSKYYTVKKGDSLYSISKKKKIPVSELKRINDLDTNFVYSGQKIYLKDSGNSKGGYHIVKSGDTLYGISKKYNVSIKDLKRINNLKVMSSIVEIKSIWVNLIIILKILLLIVIILVTLH